jgi:hypothetical protein
MFKEKVIIKQIADDVASQFGLQKYSRSKLPGTYDTLSPAVGQDGRTITGIDEDAMEINLIRDDKEREKRKKEIKALRLSLEKALGGDTDLSATSEYWDDFYVKISSDNDLVLNRVNPKHVINYNVLVANGYAIPSIKETSEPKYKNAKYYCYSEEVSKKDTVSSQKKRDEARSKLLEISENKDYMIMLGQYLEGPRYNEKNTVDDLYTMLSSYIDNLREPDNLYKFTKAIKKPVDELQFKIIIDKAIRGKVIRFSEGYYQRGQVTLGKDIEQVYNNLRSPEFASEFLSIKQELED